MKRFAMNPSGAKTATKARAATHAVLLGSDLRFRLRMVVVPPLDFVREEAGRRRWRSLLSLIALEKRGSSSSS